MEGGYFTDILPNVVGLKNCFLVGLLSTLLFINFFILSNKFAKEALNCVFCVIASSKQEQEVTY